MFITDIYNVLLYTPLVNLLVVLYQVTGQNMGVAIILLTLIIKIVTYPLTKPSLKAAQKQRELQPQIAELKKKYQNKQVFAQKQMELYRKNGVNPAAGCLPQIVQLVIIIALYQVFVKILNANGIVAESLSNLIYFPQFALDTGTELNIKFLYLNLTKPDQFYILPFLAAVSQFFLSKFMMQGTAKLEDPVKKTPEKEDDFMMAFQKQSTYIMPLFTLIIGLRLPSGLTLYWFISTLIAVIQYIILYRKDPKFINSLIKFKTLFKQNE
jgi:YidC/Oxa1 family membrane protein insertase